MWLKNAKGKEMDVAIIIIRANQPIRFHFSDPYIHIHIHITHEAYLWLMQQLKVKFLAKILRQSK